MLFFLLFNTSLYPVRAKTLPIMVLEANKPLTIRVLADTKPLTIRFPADVKPLTIRVLADTKTLIIRVLADAKPLTIRILGDTKLCPRKNLAFNPFPTLVLVARSLPTPLATRPLPTRVLATNLIPALLATLLECLQLVHILATLSLMAWVATTRLPAVGEEKLKTWHFPTSLCLPITSQVISALHKHFKSDVTSKVKHGTSQPASVYP
jgi:hypothetical protein